MNTVLHSAAGGGHLNIVSLLLSKEFDPWAENGSGKNARELVPNTNTIRVEAAFSQYIEMSFVSHTAEDPSATNARARLSGAHDEKNTTKSYELDETPIRDDTTAPALRLIAPTPDASVAGSSDEGSSRSPSPEPAISSDVREHNIIINCN